MNKQTAEFSGLFWEALSDDRILLTECTACETPFFPPSPICPYCGCEDVAWTPAPETGVLYAFTRQHRTPPGFEEPTVVGLIEMRDTVRILAPIDATYDELSIGMPVRLRPTPRGDGQDTGQEADAYFEIVPT